MLIFNLLFNFRRAIGKVLKLAFFYYTSWLLLIFLGWLASQKFFQVFSIEEAGNPDLVLNDIHFMYQNKTAFNNVHYTREKSVILINSGSLNPDSFRLHLAQVLNKLAKSKVKAIGIDHDFTKKNKIGTSELINALESNPKIVVSYRADKDDGTNDSSYLKIKAIQGNTKLPDKYTIRTYYSNDSTFAHRLASIAQPGKNKINNPNTETFYINYSAVGNGQIECIPDSTFNPLFDINFKYIEASKYLNDTANFEFFEENLKEKIVIIGHLGTIFYDRNYDVQDKYAVPVDSNRIIIRDRTMYGAVIHANALDNILKKSNFWLMNEYAGLILWQFFYILCIYFFLKFEIPKFRMIIITFFVSLAVLVAVLYAMQYNCYIPMTTPLLQVFFIEEYVDWIKPFYEWFRKKLLLPVNFIVYRLVFKVWNID